MNPQFIGSQQTHRKRRLHGIELRGEHCIEDQREREGHLATSYGPVVLEICPRGNNKVVIFIFP